MDFHEHCYLRPMAVVLACLAFNGAVGAQDSSPPQHVVHDWSTHHVIFSGLTPETVGTAVAADPRALHSWMRHARHSFGPSAQESESLPRRAVHHRHRRSTPAADWQMPIISGVGPRVYPAKFGFDVNATPDCTNDYVVFPTSNGGTPVLGGAGVHASLFAFNNLYTGPGPTGICPTPVAPAAQPSALFAYNTSTTANGKADLSPVPSMDGKKIAFIESNDGFLSNYAAFHVLTWVAGEGTCRRSGRARQLFARKLLHDHASAEPYLERLSF